jgi:phosphopantothenoylcysteine decarboxylase/phosphopantothenate--cysteine ligase
MHTAMYEHPATQANLAILRERGVRAVGPAVGRLASGGRGAGRLAPLEEILGTVMAELGAGGDLAGRRIVVSAAGTREAIDPVRFLGNRSSGKMGYALAEAARDRGASITLISAPTEVARPAGMRVVDVESAAEMLDAVRRASDGADALIMAAAVADYRPEATTTGKLKKGTEDLVLQLVRTEDILDLVRDVPVRVGFAAETDDLVPNAQGKLRAKALDLVVANAVGGADSALGADTSQAVLIHASGEREELPRLAKRELADRILDHVRALLDAG